MKSLLRSLPVFVLTLLAARPGIAQAPPCQPCAGIRVDDPRSWLAELQRPPRLQDEARLYVAWDVPLDGTAQLDVASAVTRTGAVAWLRLFFRTPPPLTEHLDELEAELEAATEIARAADKATHFQILWQPDARGLDQERVKDYAFLLKRATVTVGGANADARVISHPLPPDLDLLEALYREEVAAYLDGLAFLPIRPTALEPVVDLLVKLDPGKPLVLDAVPFPADPEETLVEAARNAVAGTALTFFAISESETPSLAALKLLAREFQGDLSYDPYSTPTAALPTGEVEAWSFVRGEDLGLRVIVKSQAGAESVLLLFSDAGLKSPARIDPETGEASDLYGALPGKDGLELELFEPEPVTLLRFERLTATERQGITGLDEEVTVVSERHLPVEEILRRLQAFEDSQQRRLDTYSGVNTTHLRFQFSTEGFEITFEGPLFFRQKEGYDWVWEKFLVSGIKWKGKRLPELPLIQPERAANLPLEISFTKEYRYRLRGTAVVDGRDSWVVDFRPAIAEPGKSLFRGTVWIDREIYARVRTRAVQLGLEGEVISNDETLFYSPVDTEGQPAEWHPDHFWLPLRLVAQQIWSVFNAAVVVEKETLLSGLVINQADFDERRQELLASELTMVRDTPDGLRYLVKEKDSDTRVVQEGFNPNRLFLAGGVFYDESFDYPLPLAGVDYFSLDFKGSGSQVNVFFAGVLVTGDWSDPRLFGSRFDAGADIRIIGIHSTDTLFRNNVEVPLEDVRSRPTSFRLILGRPLGNFTKVNLEYTLGYTDYRHADNASPDFVIPQDHFTHSVRLRGRYSRSGYRFDLDGRYSERSTWEPWGLPGSMDFDPEHRDFLRWGVSLAKTFHLKRFRKFGIELEYVNGKDLDRFSKYEFGFFSDIRVHGYQNDKVRAEEAAAIHASYGFEMGEVFRLQLIGDGAWATDQTAGFDQEFLGGVGIAGNFVGPWQTLVRLDLGLAVAGPDDGFALFLALLKLLK